MRAFIALELSPEAILEITRLQDILIKEDLFIGKLTEKENLHLTLKFLGETDPDKIEEAKKKLEEIKLEKFICELGELGVFSKDMIRIIWIKLNGEGVIGLQKEIDERLEGLFLKEERFMSHITIARVKTVKNKRLLQDRIHNIKTNKIRSSVDSFTLKRSELRSSGPVYSEIEKYNLTYSIKL